MPQTESLCESAQTQMIDNLQQAPPSIALLGKLNLLATDQDFSLVEDGETCQYLTTPTSFRACLTQITHAGWDAFQKAEINMETLLMITAVSEDMSRMEKEREIPEKFSGMISSGGKTLSSPPTVLSRSTKLSFVFSPSVFFSQTHNSSNSCAQPQPQQMRSYWLLTVLFLASSSPESYFSFYPNLFMLAV